MLRCEFPEIVWNKYLTKHPQWNRETKEKFIPSKEMPVLSQHDIIVIIFFSFNSDMKKIIYRGKQKNIEISKKVSSGTRTLVW